MLKIVWDCPTCGKEHTQPVNEADYGKFVALPCTHVVKSHGMGQNSDAILTNTEYFYFQLPKQFTYSEAEVENKKSMVCYDETSEWTEKQEEYLKNRAYPSAIAYVGGRRCGKNNILDKIVEHMEIEGKCFLDFRGPTCKYDGHISSCDHTWEDCKKHDNEENFPCSPSAGAKIRNGRAIGGMVGTTSLQKITTDRSWYTCYQCGETQEVYLIRIGGELCEVRCRKCLATLVSEPYR